MENKKLLNEIETEIVIEDIEITYANFTKYADVLNEMIFEIAIETESYIPNIISDLAKFYKIPLKRFTAALTKINSQFTCNNNIVYYFQKLPVRRTAYSCAQRKLLMRLGTKLKNAYSGVEDATTTFMNTTKLLLDIT
jgi:hypothetical protein